ncbi:MAG: peptide ABC transporter ATP-binding protein [Epulopiscium sp. Nuni2H_MBin003]|nr:MAG: peptide ABC transporter ATP-binding protein [Epulopiscium sp. Nuni2H_MBin003]
MIKIENLKMEFKSELTGEKQVVLRDVSFEVKEGDCLAVLGESGSGKSTLGRIIVGLLKPTSGKYYFLGKEPYQDKQNKRFLAEHISMVFQDYNTSVNPRFTVAEIIGECLDILRKRGKANYNKKEKISEYLKVVGLNDEFMDRFPHQLSGGQLQRVCIARALAIEPKIILFDEAISSLDAHTQVQVMDMLRELREKYNLTFIFITHDLTAVTYLCTKVMFLYDGNVEEIIDVEDISNVQSAYAQKLIDVVIEM